MSTGAWYDPLVPGEIGTLDKHGNPNVLTIDKGTSSLTQGSSAHTCLVEVERYAGELPPITAYDPPPFVRRADWTRSPRRTQDEGGKSKICKGNTE
jgi:biotin/methionine sulfoxide reductase